MSGVRRGRTNGGKSATRSAALKGRPSNRKGKPSERRSARTDIVPRRERPPKDFRPLLPQGLFFVGTKSFAAAAAVRSKYSLKQVPCHFCHAVQGLAADLEDRALNHPLRNGRRLAVICEACVRRYRTK